MNDQKKENEKVRLLLLTSGFERKTKNLQKSKRTHKRLWPHCLPVCDSHMQHNAFF